MADFPNIEPDLEEIGLIANNQIYDSILTGQVQTASLSGAKWTCTPTFSNRNGKEARDLRAFIFGQNGVSGRFNYYPASIDNVGTHAGLGVVDGAGQTGSTLETTGWDADQPLLFAAGDYITANGEMKMVTADVPVGQDYIEYDETNYMPSPFDPSGWTDGANGTVDNVIIANPSGADVLGLAEQTDVGTFTFQDSFSNDLAVNIGDKVYMSILVKPEDTSGTFDIVMVMGGTAVPTRTLRFNAKTNTFISSSMTGYKTTDLDNGFLLWECFYTVPANDSDMFARYTFIENGGGADAPIGSKCYVQATFFGKADDWPAKLRANAIIPITPPMRTSPADGALIEASNPYFQGRLESDDMSRLQVSSPVIYNTTLSIVEAF